MSDQTEPQGKSVVSLSAGRFPYLDVFEQRYGISRAQWRALTDAVFPRAKSLDSIVLALSYCQARKLDIFKRPVHIVPMWSTEHSAYVDTIWPGIGELRTTAARTGEYAGREATIWGPDVTVQYGEYTVTHPEWAEIVVKRLVGGHIASFHGPRVYWAENYAPEKFRKPEPNEMWRKRPRGQLEKCTEAAAIRTAFPEEVGNEYTADEMEGKVIEGRFEAVPPAPPEAAAKRQPSQNKLATFAGVETQEPEPADQDPHAVDRAALATVLERMKGAKSGKARESALKLAREHMTKFDETWPEGKSILMDAIASAEEGAAEET
jgi:phage recombination protein Bet